MQKQTTFIEESRRRIFTAKPFSFIWVALALSFNIVRLPLWFVYYLPPFTRPCSGWTYNQAIRMRLLKSFLYHVAFIEAGTPAPLAPGKEGQNFVTIEPADEKYYVGAVSHPRPQVMGATWYPARPRSGDEVKCLVIHIHGGAFVIGDGRQDDAGFAAATFLSKTGASHVLCPQYRTAINESCRFPAAVQDCITAYHYAVKVLGIQPSKIIVGGDSAGANLTLSLLRYLAEHGGQAGLETPSSAWLWSPWADPSVSYYQGSSAMDESPQISTDYLPGRFGVWGARAYANETNILSPYITHIGNPFHTKTSVMIQTGKCEVLFQEDCKLYEEMKGVSGNVVELFVDEFAPHDITLTGKLNGFDKEAEAAAKRAWDWSQSVSSRS